MMSRRKCSRLGAAFIVFAFASAAPASAEESGLGQWLSRFLFGPARPAQPPQPVQPPAPTQTPQAVDPRAAPPRPIEARATPPRPPAPQPPAVRAPQAEAPLGGDDPGFRAWVSRFQAQAKAAGVSEETYRRAFAGVTLDAGVLEAANRQAEFEKPVWDYLDSAVSEARIGNGRRLRIEWERTLADIERRFGVPPEIVLAVWGMESSYGAVLNNRRIVRSVIGSLATLAYAGGRRAAFGQTQLIAALKILQRGDVSPENMTGSWAGAMGHTQFIPTTYLEHAVDLDGDRRRDIWASVPDALASTANYLRASGWRRGGVWGYEVVLPSGFNYALADETSMRALSEWERRGVRRANGQAFAARAERAALVVPAGANGPAFLITQNFRAILRYNNAVSYALAVSFLGDRIGGAGTLIRPWPRSDRLLATADRIELQTLLVRSGHDLGTPDGRIGPKTRIAIRTVQSRLGMIADGYPTFELLSRLRQN